MAYGVVSSYLIVWEAAVNHILIMAQPSNTDIRIVPGIFANAIRETILQNWTWNSLCKATCVVMEADRESWGLVTFNGCPSYWGHPGLMKSYSPWCSTKKSVLLISGGDVLSREDLNDCPSMMSGGVILAKSRIVGARSMFNTRSSFRWPLAIPGPRTIRGTRMSNSYICLLSLGRENWPETRGHWVSIG